MGIPLSVAVGSPVTLDLGGKKFFLRPLNDKDYGDFEAWVQDRHIAVTKRNIEGLAPAMQEKLLDSAFARASSITITSPEGIKLTRSTEGAIKMLWLTMRRDQPNMTEADVANLVSSPAALKQAQQMIEQIERREAMAVKEAADRIPKSAAAARRPKAKRRRRRM